MTRDALIEISIFSILFAAALYNICAMLLFFIKHWSVIKETDNISEHHLDLRAYYKTRMMTNAILLIAALFLMLCARYSGGLYINLALSFSASYFAVKGFSNIFGDFITYDNIDKIQLCNLYLRPFNVDSTQLGKKIERSISKYFSEYAQVFSIGNPSTILPSLGSTSIFATDDKWKETVVTLMKRAKMIIIRIGETEGTLWELEQCVALGYQYKAIFIFNSEQQFESLSKAIGEINASINKPVTNEITAVYFNSHTKKWEFIILHNKASVKRLYHFVIESREYVDELKEIRRKRLFYWKYLFCKNNFPAAMTPFSLGTLLNCIVYYFYNRWHPATIIYYAVVSIIAHYILHPHIYDSLLVSLPCFFIYASLLLIIIGTAIFAPQISWLSRRWPSYEYFKEDNQQLNKILWAFGKGIVLYNISISIITYLIFGHPFYIG